MCRYKWMLFGVIPISSTALLMGGKKHKRYRLLIPGFVCLGILAAATLIGVAVWLLVTSGMTALVGKRVTVATNSFIFVSHRLTV